tara:strand:+ start:347 stop:793 length:447 start_codon:yes stop_codon:yes gene_type:complete
LPIENKNVYQYLVIHCSKTNQGISMAKKHESARKGYHSIIYIDGSVSMLQLPHSIYFYDDFNDSPLDELNGKTKHIILEGGINNEGNYKNNFSWKQWDALDVIVRYHILINNEIKILGANQINETESPSFNVQQWLKDMEIRKDNIYG